MSCPLESGLLFMQNPVRLHLSATADSAWGGLLYGIDEAGMGPNSEGVADFSL
jgi:hypothetical protein